MLQTNNLGKTYHTGDITYQALKNINLELAKGAFAALVGPSGSGKSTLLNICGLIDTCSEGELLFNGKNLKGVSNLELTNIRREQLGFIFQGFNLVPIMSIAENIEYPLFLADMPVKERRIRVADMLERVGLTRFAKNLPDNISGGQKQRVAIARALIKRPSLVIADEPTANLDTNTASTIIDLMHHMSREFNSTFIIATHDDRMSSRCDTEIHLVDGELQ
ncbi:MAG: ABC transporter ATP-binding protein [Pseudomonadota bacterium]